jgi:uncharacterized membrane protein YbhN (UPF0104 family)
MKRVLFLLVATLLCVICLWLTFRTASFEEVWGAIRAEAGAWPWFLASGAVMVSNIVFRGFRYDRILAGRPEVGLKKSITLTGIMFLGNSILPLRAGEAIRIFLPMRMFGIPLASSVSFHAADRLFDFVAILVLMALSFVFAADTIAVDAAAKSFPLLGREYNFESLIAASQNSTIVFLVIGFLGVTVVCLAPEPIKKVIATLTTPLGERWSSRLVGFVDHIHHGVSVFRKPKDVLLAAFWTFMVWYMVILNVQILAGIFGESLTWAQAGLITVLVAAAVSLPQLPGYVGTFQLAFTVGLHFCFGIEQVTAAAIAWSAWFFQIFPVMSFGFLCMFYEGLSFRSFSEAQETVG